MLSQNGIFFLPDISGFTEFVNKTEISHSKHIIKELIELIISLSPDVFDVVEIEGDAVFLVTEEENIALEELFHAIEHMYIQFHDHLKLFESKRICPCGACSTASNLTVKFVVHVGELDYLQIKGEKKPYGPDVILAHRLLKNSIMHDAYALISGRKIQIDSKESTDNTLNWRENSDEYDGKHQPYQFIELSYLNSKIRTYKKESLKPPNIDPIQAEHEFDLNIYELYEIISNLNYRALWNTDPEGFEFEENRVNRIGESHICIINEKTKIDFETIHSDFGKNKLVYGELTRNAPIVDELYNYFVLENINDQTKLTVMIYPMMKSKLKQLLFLPLARIKFKKNMQLLFEHLHTYFEDSSIVEMN
jgi:hypothetical protein